MSTVHDEIASRLKDVPDDVREIGLRAIELSGENSETSVVEQLNALVRKLARECADDSQ